MPDAKSLSELPNKSPADYVGMVITRQRPRTASGVTFMTLEDETGFVNLVVWKQVFAEYRLIAKTASVMGITGEVQKAEGVVHFIAKKLWWPPDDMRRIKSSSRDFR